MSKISDNFKINDNIEYITALRLANGESVERVSLKSVDKKLLSFYLREIKNNCNSVLRKLK